MKNLTKKTGLEIFKVEKLSTHGGSNRVFFKKKINQKVQISKKYIKFLLDEKKFGIEKLSTYRKFARNVKKSKNALISIFRKIKNDGKIIIGYGATYKSSTVLNYCGLKNNFIDYFLDTTPTKFGKFTPGSHIPIYQYKGIPNNVKYAYLGLGILKMKYLKRKKNILEMVENL